MLVLSLPHNPKSEVFYVQASANAQWIQSLTAPIDGLPASKEEVVGVLPWQQVSWHLIRVPKDAQKILLGESSSLTRHASTSSRAQQLLEGLLEEQLLDELSQLHWIAAKTIWPHENTPSPTKGTSSGDNAQVQLWVACCNRAWLNNILDSLEAQHILVDRLVPEFEPTLNESHVYACEGAWGLELILTNSQGVMGFPKEALNAFSTALGEAVVVHFEPSVGDQISSLFQGDMQLLTRTQRLLEATQSSWDFAKGQWAQGSLRRLLKNAQKSSAVFLHHSDWKMTRVGLLMLFALNVLFLNLWSWQERQSLQAQKAQLSHLLKSTFPEVQVVIDPKVQMLRSLRALEERTATPSLGDFEHLLSTFSRLSSVNPELDVGQIQSLRYGASELTLIWKTPSSSMANSPLKMPQDLEALGYRVSSQGQETRLHWNMTP
jgi:general secretion pathway protein L